MNYDQFWLFIDRSFELIDFKEVSNININIFLQIDFSTREPDKIYFK